MEQKINLQQLEKRTAASIFQTGIVDISLGLIYVLSSMAMIFDSKRFYFYFLYFVPVVFIILTLKYVVRPRMGAVTLTRSRIKRSKAMMIALTVFLVMMLILTIFGDVKTIVELVNPEWIISGIIFLAGITIAYFLDFDRMYFYAFLMAGAFHLTEEMRKNPDLITERGYVDLAVSILLIVIGMSFLIKFLKKNPRPENEA